MLGGVALASVGVSGAILVPYLLRKEKVPMSRFEAAILSMTVMVTLTSAGLLVPFDVNSNVLAVIGFAIILVWNDVKLPRHVFDGVTTMVGRVFDGVTAMVGRVFDGVTAMVRGVLAGVTAMVRGISRGMASVAGTFGTAIMSIFGNLRLAIKAMIEVWSYAKIEDITKLLPLAALLAFAPAIANRLHDILQYFAGAAVAVLYGQGPTAANLKAAAHVAL